MREDYTLVDETRHAQRAPCSACGKKAANLVSIDSGPLICTPCALAAARRAGAEEMRERCEVACNDLAEREDERYLRAVNNATREDANMRAAAFRAAVRELRALHPDAKGGDHA